MKTKRSLVMIRGGGQGGRTSTRRARGTSASCALEWLVALPSHSADSASRMSARISADGDSASWQGETSD
eukprot:7998229-Pyramimonas_sp.AAC.1